VEEVSQLLGRLRPQCKAAVDGPAGYRNGYGKPGRLALRGGTITVQRPRVRVLVERFESRVLPLFKRHTAQVGGLLPELCLHGPSSGDFNLALHGLLIEAAPLSASSLDWLKAVWQAENEAGKLRPLPTPRTMERVLQRDGLTAPQIRLAPLLPRQERPGPQARASNQLHEVDLVGQIYLQASGHRS
jgi:hypothetical protein